MKMAGKVFALVYSAFMVFLLLAFMILFYTRIVLSKDFLAKSLSELDYGAITVKALGLDSYLEKYGEDATVEDAITAELEELGVDTETAKKVVNDKNLREFVGGMASELITAGVNGETMEKVTLEEIEESLSVLELTDDQYRIVTDFLNDAIDVYNEEVINSGSGV